MAEIRVERLHKDFQGFVAVQNSSFVIEDRSFFVMLGPSGCGKTTTLRMIAGLELPTEGRILLDGKDVTFKRASERDIAFVFQLFALYPHMNVRRNIAFPLVSMGMKRADVRARVEEAARILRITELLDRPVSGLSGGDRQRVALGRAIVRRPMAFMMDEPLGALDSELRDVMCGELRGLHDRLKATTVYVTHDQTEAMALGDRIAVMSHGVIEQLGTPREIYDRPASMFVADFIGSPPMNLLTFSDSLEPGRGSVRVGQAEISIPAPREAIAARDLILGVRPEHVRLNDGARLRGEVFGTEYLGTTQIVTVTTAHGMVKARLASTFKVSIGDPVGLEFRPDRISLFDAGSGRAIRTALHDQGQAVERAHV
jgi:multiple sugar transport system ATP-binding protein